MVKSLPFSKRITDIESRDRNASHFVPAIFLFIFKR